MAPTYVFRIDDMIVGPNVEPIADAHGSWIPPTDPGSNKLRGGGISGKCWKCNGLSIERLTSLPQGAAEYKTYSIYYSQGFWISNCDASRTNASAETWHRLSFDHDDENYSSYLTYAGENPTLMTQRGEQDWPAELLPNIYHPQRSSWSTNGQSYGGLNGELPIMLGLIAFSIAREHSEWAISNCFADGSFRVHGHPNGWAPGRGMVIRVFTYPGSNSEASSDASDLEELEAGDLGNYFN